MPVPRRPASRQATRLKWAAVVVCVVLGVVATLVGLRSPMVHQYEYQEDVYVSLDGKASIYVSASLPALVALHAMDLPTDPRSPLDRAQVRRAFDMRGVTLSAISTWRRHGRRFVTVRLDAPDIRHLPAIGPFAAAAFEFGRAKDGYRLVERLGGSSNHPVGDVGWTGRELVGFRWHIPSRVERYNAPEENFLRGNILVWEQPLRKRLAGEPMLMDVLMAGETILSNALWLFLVSAVSAVVVVAVLVGWVVRRRRPAAATTVQ
jgi:hypothetical protein